MSSQDTSRVPGVTDTEKPVDRQELVIPISPHVDAVIWLPPSMTPGAWDQMMAVLEAMKPGIVPGIAAGHAKEPPPPAEAGESGS